MKRNTTRSNGNGTSPVPTQLDYSHPTATAVYVAGTFNDWQPEATPMVALGEGRWTRTLPLAPGVYEYLIVSDYEWIPDPRAKETVPNPYGGRNSVLRVKGCGSTGARAIAAGRQP
ncbi:MAG TPA: glycogen-binding domain-containing protein [Lacunisphaera sp.]|nr:glycogen-binding domain-containing protein [Lacunisphaera sp.]